MGITNPRPEPEPAPSPEPNADEPSDGDVYDGAKDLYGDDMPDIPPGSQDPEGGDGKGQGGDASGTGRGAGGVKTGPGAGGSPKGGGKGASANGNGRAGDGRSKDGTSPRTGKRDPGSRPFISYVAAHPDEEEHDPDGLDQATRMAVESQAIDKIIALEPLLQRTPDGNPGFDLYEINAVGKPVRWVDVKSMTGSISDRPVGLSRTQFACAQEHGLAYWLYVVEHATEARRSRILRIQDPAGNIRTFTFDQGWAAIAKTEGVDTE